jgi:hypothetical protein
MVRDRFPLLPRRRESIKVVSIEFVVRESNQGFMTGTVMP